MRDIEVAARKGDAAAVLALEVFDRTVAKTVAGYSSVLGGLDALSVYRWDWRAQRTDA